MQACLSYVYMCGDKSAFLVVLHFIVLRCAFSLKLFGQRTPVPVFASKFLGHGCPPMCPALYCCERHMISSSFFQGQDFIHRPLTNYTNAILKKKKPYTIQVTLIKYIIIYDILKVYVFPIIKLSYK